MIHVKELTYRYDDGKVLTFPDFSVGRGETCLLLGNSGSGKTTLLHIIGGLLRTEPEHVVVNGQDLGMLSEIALDRFRGEHIGFIFQRNHLIDALTVRQNLLMAPFLAGLEQNRKRVEEVLDQLGLNEVMHRPVQEISQGQAQRVAIARALINRPTLILADEPTSALDDENCDRVIHLLLDLSEQNGSTLLVATHDQRLKSVIDRQVPITDH